MTPQQTRVLVTGGTGLIGAEVCRAMVRRGVTVVAMDSRPNLANIAEIADQITLVRRNVTDEASMERALTVNGITHVIHLAALLTMDASHSPKRAVVTNCVGAATVFDAAVRAGVSRIVWTSTAGVYGTRPYYDSLLGRHVVTEEDPLAPYDLYGATKQLCEMLAAQYRTDGLDVVGLRPVMTFGVGRFFGAVGVLNQAFKDAATRGHGLVTEPWAPDASINPMYVKDAAEIIAATTLHPRPLARPVYNLGTGEYLTLQAMVDLALSKMGPGASIKFGSAVVGPEAAGVPMFDYPDVDSTALRKELDWSPTYGFEAAIDECIDHYRNCYQVG